MTEAEARQLIADKLPPADGDRVESIRRASWVEAAGFLEDLEERTGRQMTAREIDAITTEAAAVDWLTAA